MSISFKNFVFNLYKRLSDLLCWRRNSDSLGYKFPLVTGKGVNFPLPLSTVLSSIVFTLLVSAVTLLIEMLERSDKRALKKDGAQRNFWKLVLPVSFFLSAITRSIEERSSQKGSLKSLFAWKKDNPKNVDFYTNGFSFQKTDFAYEKETSLTHLVHQTEYSSNLLTGKVLQKYCVRGLFSAP